MFPKSRRTTAATAAILAIAALLVENGAAFAVFQRSASYVSPTATYAEHGGSKKDTWGPQPLTNLEDFFDHLAATPKVAGGDANADDSTKESATLMDHVMDGPGAEKWQEFMAKIKETRQQQQAQVAEDDNEGTPVTTNDTDDNNFDLPGSC